VTVFSDGGELVSVFSEPSLSTSQVAWGVRIYFHTFSISNLNGGG